jgi:hypothetical protein
VSTSAGSVAAMPLLLGAALLLALLCVAGDARAGDARSTSSPARASAMGPTPFNPAGPSPRNAAGPTPFNPAGPPPLGAAAAFVPLAPQRFVNVPQPEVFVSTVGDPPPAFFCQIHNRGFANEQAFFEHLGMSDGVSPEFARAALFDGGGVWVFAGMPGWR